MFLSATVHVFSWISITGQVSLWSHPRHDLQWTGHWFSVANGETNITYHCHNMTLTCNFARVAVRHFTQQQMTKRHQLPKGSGAKVVHNYNDHFSVTSSMQVTCSYGLKHFTRITQRFNNRWRSTKSRVDYLKEFSLEKWGRLSTPEKEKHTLHDCQECQMQFPLLSAAFPGAKKKVKTPAVAFSKSDLSTPQKFGRKVLRELNVVTQTKFKKSIQEVIQETPKSHMIKKPSSAERKAEKRKLQKEVIANIQEGNTQLGQNIVLQNRISWRAFDKIRKTEGLATTPKRSRDAGSTEETPEPQPKRQRRHGSLSVEIDMGKLLEEASSWSQQEKVNWTQLARKYGLTTANGGQVIKEILYDHKIPAASISQRKTRASRRPRKKLKRSRVSFPMHRTLNFHRQILKQRIADGELAVGEEVVPSSYPKFSVDLESLTITEENQQVKARKIALQAVREKLLQEHDKLGLLRNISDEQFASLTLEEIQTRLQELHEAFQPDDCIEQLRDRLVLISRRRHIKIWHDHSSISGHGHFLVLLSAIYDPAIYYTPEEMEAKTGRKVDVQSVVEAPQIHILGRSSSSIEDQLKFNVCRVQSLADLASHLKTNAGTTVQDILRFFHGDGPAQQFEAGHKQGGNYSCTGCGSLTARFDDLTYCHYSPKLSFLERQEFVLQGHAWRKKGKKPHLQYHQSLDF